MRRVQHVVKAFVLMTFLFVGGLDVHLEAQVLGGMLSPNVDVPGEPFSYFWHPTDVIGTPFASIASELTPEGYIYTGLGELMFLVGNPPEPVNQRIKTLERDQLPVFRYHTRYGDIKYSFTVFAADIGGDLKGLPVNFIEVELSNLADGDRTGFLSSAFRFMPPRTVLDGPPDYRFAQRLDLIPKQYIEGQVSFDPRWKYSFGDNGLLRDGRFLYLFPSNIKPSQTSLSLGDKGLRAVRFFSGEIRDERPPFTLDPHMPMGVATYRIRLAPKQSQKLLFKMPIVPIVEGSAAAKSLQEASYEHYLQQTLNLWDAIIGRMSRLTIPEQKVQSFLVSNTLYDLLAIDKQGSDFVMNVNKFQYHGYYPGNCADMIVALDYVGLHDIARDLLLYAYKMQSPDGGMPIPSQPDTQSIETWGYVLWAWARHYQLTNDTSFLHQIYPGVELALKWEKQMTQRDSQGLMPPSTVADDTYLKATRQTGENIWTLIGLRNAIRLAEAMGRPDDVLQIKAEYQRYWDAFELLLSIQTAKTGGYIPPALERTVLGNNWDNLATLYPDLLFQPFDSRVTATISQSRSGYVEGILDYVVPFATAKEAGTYVFDSTPRLHYWQTHNNAENALVRGTPEDQRLAVQDLYALLLHTSSTHAPQEFGTFPWSTRDYLSGDILPDGATSARTIQLLRNMIAREYKGDLVLFSALSPFWLQSGQKVEAADLPTEFGALGVTLDFQPGELKVKVSIQPWKAPGHLIVRIPWFYQLRSATADGKPVEATNGELVLPPDTSEITIKGKVKTGVPLLSFDNAVKEYKIEYGNKYQEFLRTGRSYSESLTN